MGRAFPRFLLSKSTQSKSKGTFIIHTLDPPFLAEPEFNELRQIIDVHIVEVWEGGDFYKKKAAEIAMKEIPNWWKYSGIHDSCDIRDKIIAKLSRLSYLKEVETEFTLEQAQEVIRIIFPTKAKAFYHRIDSYGIKHDLERISQLFTPGRHKYCNNKTIKDALIKEGFKTKTNAPDSPNLIANISEQDVSLIRDIIFYRVNNLTTTEAF